MLKESIRKVMALFAAVEQEKHNDEDFLVDAVGRRCPLNIIKPTELARHKLVMEISDKALEIKTLLTEFKALANSDIDAFSDISASDYGVVNRGKKGGLSLYNFDATRMIKIATSARFVFNEKLQTAKTLLDELIEERSENMDDMMRTLINDVFQVDVEGNINRSRILELRKFNFDDPKWEMAMDAINDSMQPIDRKAYIQFFERDNSQDKWRSILLDLAKV